MTDTAGRECRAAARRRVAETIRRSLWTQWGNSVPYGDETLSSLGNSGVAGYLKAADDVLDTITPTDAASAAAGSVCISADAARLFSAGVAYWIAKDHFEDVWRDHNLPDSAARDAANERDQLDSAFHQMLSEADLNGIRAQLAAAESAGASGEE